MDVAHPGATAGELDLLVSLILPPELTGTFVREDVTVPVAHFAQTLVDGATAWLHPGVPFGAIVKDGGQELTQGAAAMLTVHARL